MTRKLISGILVLSVAVLMLGACAAPTASVTGTVTYLEKIALDPAATIVVNLVDNTRQDVHLLVGQQVITAGGKQVPFNFELNYSPDYFNPANSYVVQAEITVNGQRIFATDKDYPVISRGNPSTVEVVLRKV